MVGHVDDLTDAPAGRRRALIVGTGAPGGIGRVEQMMAEAFLDDAFAPGWEVTALWRRRHPDYLRHGAIEELPTVTEAPCERRLDHLRALAAAIRRQRPDLVVYMHVNLARTAQWLRPLGHPRHYVVWTYGVEIWPRLPAGHRAALRDASAVLTISNDSVRRTVETQGVAPDRVRLIPLTLPQEAFAAAEDRAPEPGRLLTVARLGRTEQGKNLDRLVAAMRDIRAQHPHARLTVIGDGDGRGDLERLAHELGVADIVSFPGTVSDARLRDEYLGAELFVLPSEKEGFGLVFIEAMLMRTAVLGLARGGPLDVVRDGVDGRLIEDLDELPGVLGELLAAPARLREMGDDAGEGVRARFSPAQFRGALAAALGVGYAG